MRNAHGDYTIFFFIYFCTFRLVGCGNWSLHGETIVNEALIGCMECAKWYNILTPCILYILLYMVVVL